jgi:ankyrin repeat protein
LFQAIAAGKKQVATRLLEGSPQLALESALVGATRQSAASHWLAAIQHYVFAGDTALHIAARAYRTDLAKVLVGYGADVSARNRRGAEPLHDASTGLPGSKTWNPKAQAAIIEYLLRAGAGVNSADKSGVTALHKAVRTRCAAAVRVLLEHDADVRRKNGNGSTPLHLAVQNTGRGGTGATVAREQQAEIIRLLVTFGARPLDRDARGRTVAECVSQEWIRAILKA